MTSVGRHEIWSFFSGALGLDLGLEQAGLRPTLAVELDPRCCATIRDNRPDLHLLEADVSALDGRHLRRMRGYQDDVFMCVGGPPCQSFSSGGRRAALSDPRGNLIYEFLRLVSEIKPRYFVLENVANLMTAALRHRRIVDRPGQHWSLKRYDAPGFNGGSSRAPALAADERASTAVRRLLSDVSRLSYSIRFGVVDAADYGAPQRRLRFVMFGSRSGSPPPLPKPTHGPLGSGLLPFATVRDAIYRFRDDPGPHSEYTPAVMRYFALVPEGKNWRALPPRLQRKALGGSWEAGGGKTGFYRRLGWDRPAPTITGRANRKGSALCHPEYDRPLSVRECAALQGFPDGWRFTGAMNAQYMQVGNAVPVNLGTAIGGAFTRPRISHRRAETTTADIDAMLEAATQRLRAAARNHSAIRTPQIPLALW